MTKTTTITHALLLADRIDSLRQTGTALEHEAAMLLRALAEDATRAGSSPSASNLAAAHAVLDAQAEKGMRRYGVPLERSPLSLSELAQMAAEEMADGLAYFVALKQRAEVMEDVVNTAIAVVRDWDRNGAILSDDGKTILLTITDSTARALRNAVDTASDAAHS